jgi:hypothetical protein
MPCDLGDDISQQQQRANNRQKVIEPKWNVDNMMRKMCTPEVHITLRPISQRGNNDPEVNANDQKQNNKQFCNSETTVPPNFSSTHRCNQLWTMIETIHCTLHLLVSVVNAQQWVIADTTSLVGTCVGRMLNVNGTYFEWFNFLAILGPCPFDCLWWSKHRPNRKHARALSANVNGRRSIAFL